MLCEVATFNALPFTDILKRDSVTCPISHLIFPIMKKIEILLPHYQSTTIYSIS